MNILERINMKERRFLFKIYSLETIHRSLYIENSNPKVIITKGSLEYSNNF